MASVDVVKNAALTVSKNVGHFNAMKRIPPYIVWAEDGQGDSLWADGQMQEQVITGTIDLFTKSSREPLFEKIQRALSDAEISFRWNSTQYEEDTGLYHHEWVWEIG